MRMRNKNFYNSSGYADPTAYTAIRNIERKEAKQKISRLFKILRAVISKSGFMLLNDIKLKEAESGLVFTYSHDEEPKR